MSQVSDFYYELPPELIAQTPLAERTASRMLVVSRKEGAFRDESFNNFDRYIRPGDCLVLNDTKVFPARLHGRRAKSGAAVEVFLVRALNEAETEWQALVRPGKRVRCGEEIDFGETLSATVLAQGEFGERTIRFHTDGSLPQLLEQLGQTPLPPYIQRAPEPDDASRYQTVFAQQRGSVAAPTAGLHFTPQMLNRCREAGAELAYLTLHVGLGTFAPLRETDLAKIQLHRERFEVTAANAEILGRAKRLFCVGTTSVRTVETLVATEGEFVAAQGETDLFIHPGFQFRGTGAMLTNFHLPASSLLLLVCAFAGTELTLAAYRHAVEEHYRFFSYGDCMLIE